ncbi:MAG: methyltransferase domain-containing protein [Candidatus Parcubacteria bacterium]|nr:methyltransferase domain-containing protein [Candidatus Parcubacteria bacterium]
MKNILKKIYKDNDIGTNNQRIREMWLKEKLKNIPAGVSILDAGAGELQYKSFCEHLKYTSQDFGKYNGEGDSKGLQTKKWDNSRLDIISDIINIPRPDASFGAIMCIEVFEHIPEPAKAIKEFSRLLKTKGKLIITAPFCSMTHFAPYHFSTGFNKYFYEKVLRENGFRIIDIAPNGNYYEYLAQEVRRIPSIAGRYSHSKTSIFEKIVFKITLSILNKYNKKDSGSNELLCFGYNVLAEKI